MHRQDYDRILIRRTAELVQEGLSEEEAAARAARELDEARWGKRGPPDDLREGADKLFGERPPPPEVSDQTLEEAAERLFA